MCGSDEYTPIRSSYKCYASGVNEDKVRCAGDGVEKLFANVFFFS